MKVVQRLTIALDYCDASGKGAGGVWFDLNGDGVKFVWRLQWPDDVVADLVSWTNTKGRIMEAATRKLSARLSRRPSPLTLLWPTFFAFGPP